MGRTYGRWHRTYGTRSRNFKTKRGAMGYASRLAGRRKDLDVHVVPISPARINVHTHKRSFGRF